MDKAGHREIHPHPDFLDILFASKGKLSSVFRDVLGLYEISHIAVSYVNRKRVLLTLSSTPALEFNLFQSNLWRFDGTYQPGWYELCSQANWQSLYSDERYDELYYIKQARHRYPLALSLSAKLAEGYVIYSIASSKNCGYTKELFEHQQEHFYKIGQYCTNLLWPCFMHYDATLRLTASPKAKYETSN